MKMSLPTRTPNHSTHNLARWQAIRPATLKNMYLLICCTMGISGSEKCINKNGETQNIAKNGQIESYFWGKMTK